MHKIVSTDRLLFVRFYNAFPHQLIIRTQNDNWIWYDAFFCLRDAKCYLIPVEECKPETIPIACFPGERFVSYWADKTLLLPTSRIEKRSGSRIVLFTEYPTIFRDGTFFGTLGYASNVLCCSTCQDQFPVLPGIPDSDQCFCAHILWCSICGQWSTPPFPESTEREEKACHHYEFLFGQALKKHLDWTTHSVSASYAHENNRIMSTP